MRSQFRKDVRFMGDIYTTLGSNLKLLLLITGKSKAELAADVGVSRATVTGWVSGGKVPHREHIEALCEVLTEYIRGIVPMRVNETLLLMLDLRYLVINKLKIFAEKNNLWLEPPYSERDLDAELMQER